MKPTDASSIPKNSVWRFFVSVTLPIVILVLLLRSVGWTELKRAFGQLDPVGFLPVILLHLFVIFAGAPLIWRIVLKPLGCRPGLAEIYRIWVGTTSLRSVLPMKSGGLVCANALRLAHGFPLSRGIGSLALLHFLNFYSLWVFLLIGLWWTGTGNPFFVAALTAVIALLPFALPFLGAFAGIAGRIHPRFGEILRNLISGFTELPLPTRLAVFAAVIVLQMADVFVIGFGLRAGGMSVPVSELFLRVPLVYLIANLPLTIMGLGTREAAMVFVFSVFGPRASILAVGIGLFFCMEILPSLLSLAFLPDAVRRGFFSPKD